METTAESTRSVLDVEGIAQLIALLQRRGYQVAGPTLRDGAINYEVLRKLEDLPAGWTDEQAPGRYRVTRRKDNALFGYTVGPQSWKKFLHPSELPLVELRRDGANFQILHNHGVPPRFAFLGVRACELAAIAVQDRVFQGGRFTDPHYEGRRSQVFMVAVHCTQAGPNCFCASMGTGPWACTGFDLALTEVIDGGRHLFVVEAGTKAGTELLEEMYAAPAPPELCRQAEESVRRASLQTRQMDTAGIRDLLYENFDHPEWDNVAARCLSCANCTMVCPTCFCTTVDDLSEVTGERAGRWRRWDSCFTQSFSYIHGGSVRTSSTSRFRQWMTHKLASWIDQFGTSGCVGCGRCITWCPVGIDITEEVRAIRGGRANAAPVSKGDNIHGIA
ncbi:MAG TPA: 4Fe-4S dicluster domain-containing protein [Bryobacteraceae bacterium]|nr:4Fe-4S dicluster domain-containing protein [Bryobacteraceae bacterium]HZW93015.1 4Fe-4S dicluster domain-containing protein [Candidatus Eremiobacteraceae bacterium]